MTKVYATLIGIDTYRDSSSNTSGQGWTPLTGPENDVAALKVALQDCWTPEELHIQEFTGARAKQSVLTSNLENIFGTTASEDSLIIVYFAGHACLVSSDDLYLIAYDTQHARIREMGLAARDVRKWMDASLAKDIVLILDCCYSGAAMSETQSPEGQFRKVAKSSGRSAPAMGQSRAVLASSWLNQPSLEERGSRGGHGIYTKFLLQALASNAPGARNARGEIDAISLQSYIVEQLQREGYLQRPLQDTWGGQAPVLRPTRDRRGKSMDTSNVSARGDTQQVVMRSRNWARQDLANEMITADLAPAGTCVVVGTKTSTSSQLTLLTANGTGDRVITLRDADTLQEIAFRSDSKEIAALTFNSATNSSVVSLYPVADNGSSSTIALREFGHSTGAITRLQYLNDTMLVVAGVGEEGQALAQIWSVQGQEIVRFSRERVGKIAAFTIRPNRYNLAAISCQGQQSIYLWDITTAEIGEPRGGKSRKTAMRDTLSMDEDPWFITLLDDGLVAAIGKSGTINFINLPDGSRSNEPLQVPHAPTAFLSSPSGDFLACGTLSGSVYLVARERPTLNEPVRLSSRISDLAFSPDNDSYLIAAAAANGEVRLWNYLTGKTVEFERQNRGGETFLRFSADGTRLLVASQVGAVLELWDIERITQVSR